MYYIIFSHLKITTNKRKISSKIFQKENWAKLFLLIFTLKQKTEKDIFLPNQLLKKYISTSQIDISKFYMPKN